MLNTLAHMFIVGALTLILIKVSLLEKTIMATQAQLEALITSINTQIDTITADLNTAISDIKAQGTSIDLTSLQAVADKLTAFDAAVKADDPGAPTPTPKPAA